MTRESWHVHKHTYALAHTHAQTELKRQKQPGLVTQGTRRRRGRVVGGVKICGLGRNQHGMTSLPLHLMSAHKLMEALA